MARLRTFLAVGLGKSQRDRCVALQENLAQAGTPVNWVERDNLHVTLLFLGEIDEREIPVVCQAVATVAAGHAPFSLELEGVSGFPTPERPRTLYVNVSTGSEELATLYADLEAKLVEEVRYRRETRPYVPHVTLGRPRRDEGEAALTALLEKYARWDGGANEVREIQVLSSQLLSSGPIYSILSRARLKG